MAKSKPISVLLGVLTVVAVLAIAPSAFAQMSMEVDIAKGAGASANADCVNANNCFNPNPVNVAPGDTVTWKNMDTVGHTVTSGKPTDNDAGSLFDSSSAGLIKPGASFQFTFQNEGTYNYFCQVHPWMTGQVIVSASAAGQGQQGGIPLGGPYTAPPGSSTPQPAQPAPPSQAPQYGSQVPTNASAGQGQQGGIPLGSNYTAPAGSTTPQPAQPAPPSQAPQYGSQVPASTEAGVGQQGGIPLGQNYGVTAQPTPDASTIGWITGIVVIAIMSGIGVWSAARRR